MERNNRTVWPMQPGGGLFLICVGLGLLWGAILQGPAVKLGLEVGFAVGAASIFLAIFLAKGRFGRPTASQRIVMLAAIGFELIVFAILARKGFFGEMHTSTGWAVVLAVVAAHFIMMRWSHGPLILWLGIASLAWIGMAYVSNQSLGVLVAGDALLKISFGGAMAAPLWLRGAQLRSCV